MRGSAVQSRMRLRCKLSSLTRSNVVMVFTVVGSVVRILAGNRAGHRTITDLMDSDPWGARKETFQ